MPQSQVIFLRKHPDNLRRQEVPEVKKLEDRLGLKPQERFIVSLRRDYRCDSGVIADILNVTGHVTPFGNVYSVSAVNNRLATLNRLLGKKGNRLSSVRKSPPLPEGFLEDLLDVTLTTQNHCLSEIPEDFKSRLLRAGYPVPGAPNNIIQESSLISTQPQPEEPVVATVTQETDMAKKRKTRDGSFNRERFADSKLRKIDRLVERLTKQEGFNNDNAAIILNAAGLRTRNGSEWDQLKVSAIKFRVSGIRGKRLPIVKVGSEIPRGYVQLIKKLHRDSNQPVYDIPTVATFLQMSQEADPSKTVPVQALSISEAKKLGQQLYKKFGNWLAVGEELAKHGVVSGRTGEAYSGPGAKHFVLEGKGQKGKGTVFALGQPAKLDLTPEPKAKNIEGASKIFEEIDQIKNMTFLSDAEKLRAINKMTSRLQ